MFVFSVPTTALFGTGQAYGRGGRDKPEACMTALAKLRKSCRGLGSGDF